MIQVKNQDSSAQILVGSIDQSTTSTKFSIFKKSGQLIAKSIIEHQQITTQDGYLEHNPLEILSNTHAAIKKVLDQLKNQQKFNIKRLVGLGVCNQRETVVCWDKNGKPLYNAIVWCDTRTKEICQNFKNKFGDFKDKTGLPVSTYFTLFKIIWLLQNVPQVKKHFDQGDIKFGTIDSWLVYNLTGKHVTDASNASRTYMCNLKGHWDADILKLYNIKQQYLPQIVDSFSIVGEIQTGQLKGTSICCILGDQQSSAYAHQLQIDQMKITYGTGCFLLNNIGTTSKIHKSFITTILSKHKDIIQYGYQVAIQCGGGTMNWAKKSGFLNNYQQLNTLKPHNSQLIFLPSFGTIFAPFWKDNVQGGLLGLNYNTTQQDILYSILQSIAFRLYDNIKFEDFEQISKIVVDGGMTINPFFMQLNSSIFQKNIEVCQLDTCWGVAKGVLVALNIPQQKIKNISKKYIPNNQLKEFLMKRYAFWNDHRNTIYKLQ